MRLRRRDKLVVPRSTPVDFEVGRVNGRVQLTVVIPGKRGGELGFQLKPEDARWLACELEREARREG